MEKFDGYLFMRVLVLVHAGGIPAVIDASHEAMHCLKWMEGDIAAISAIFPAFGWIAMIFH